MAEKTDLQTAGTKRKTSFECCRAVCMLWIVAIWHGREYVYNLPWQLGAHVFSDITKGTLATFVFISGYFLGKKKFEDRQSVLAFYRRRLSHLYLPFFVSCTLLLIMHAVWGTTYIRSFQQYLLSLTGLALFFPPAPATVWFVVFLLPCQVIAPFLVRSRNRVTACLFVYACTVFITAALKQVWDIEADSRILLYLPVFLVGICLPHAISENVNIIRLLLSLLVITLLEAVGIHCNSPYRYALIGSMIIAFLEFGKLLNSNPALAKTGEAIGSISLSAYLFHRQFFYLVWKIAGEKLSMAAMYLLVIPLFFAILYFGRPFVAAQRERRPAE